MLFFYILVKQIEVLCILNFQMNEPTLMWPKVEI